MNFWDKDTIIDVLFSFSWKFFAFAMVLLLLRHVDILELRLEYSWLYGISIGLLLVFGILKGISSDLFRKGLVKGVTFISKLRFIGKYVRKTKISSSYVIVKSSLKYVFLALLLLVTVSSLSFEFLLNSWFGVVISFLQSIQMWLTVVTIVVGVFVFWMHREVIDEVEAEKDEEEKKELKRAKEFDRKFSRLKPPERLSLWFQLKRLFSK